MDRIYWSNIGDANNWEESEPMSTGTYLTTSYVVIREELFIDMADLQGVYEQLYAIGEGWA